MDQTEIIDFLKNDIRGLLIVGGAASVAASVFYELTKSGFRKFYSFLNDRYNKYKVIKRVDLYGKGYAAGFAKGSTYMQIVLVGDYIIKIVFYVGTILLSFLLFIAILIMLKEKYYWVSVIIFSTIVTFQLLILKSYFKLYEQLIFNVFGKEFVELKEKRMKERYDSESSIL